MNLPNSLTLIRIFLTPLLVYLLIYISEFHSIIAASVFLAAAVTDWLDGHLARRRQQVTTLGKLLDPVADKILVSAALISMVQIDLVPGWIVMLIVGREFAVTGLRGIAATHGVVIEARDLAKYKTALQYVTIILLILTKSIPAEIQDYYIYFSMGALWMALGVTLYSGVDYFVRFFRTGDMTATVKREDRWH
jgi:CDP-diacylglycerol--glycerol-3-phosphate 3-phosphatidyltransferase